MRRLAVCVLLAMVTGCGGAGGEEAALPSDAESDALGEDDGGGDGAVDSSAADSTRVDTGTPDDAAVDTASGASDSASVDGATTDAGRLPDTTSDAVTDGVTDAVTDAATDSGSVGQDVGITVPSNIKHVILIVQENHTFDTYFGAYCTAAVASNPTCNVGPACCEKAPSTEPGGRSPITLTDSANAAFDPNHSRPCEIAEIDNGKMDRFTTGSGVTACSDAKNFAIAPNPLLRTYHGYAKSYAIADRYFQPYAGASCANNMYFARAQYVFTDNEFEPDSIGAACSISRTKRSFTEKTIADLMLSAGKTFSVYAEGYGQMKTAQSGLIPYCPFDPACTFVPTPVPTAPCAYEPADIPFAYYKTLADKPEHFRDFSQLTTDLAGTLPSFSYVKALQWKNEHPAYGTNISNGVDFVDGIVKSVLASKYASDTLILLTWDEGGGFYDHIAPPPNDPTDGQPYGTRIPLIAIGNFARTNWVSHVQLEHSSIVKFLELNFLGATGQLSGRDVYVNNIGSLLDASKTGIVVP